MPNFIHPLADVKSLKIGEGTKVWQFTVVLENASVGSNCNINCNCFIENDVIIGNNVTVKSGVQIWDGIEVEDDVFIGPNTTFTNDIIPRSKLYPAEFKRTYIKKGASVGANSTIVAGIIIGEFALVGAGSVVTKNVPPFTVWYGNPARHKGYITSGNILLSLNLVDLKTNERFELIGEQPQKTLKDERHNK